MDSEIPSLYEVGFFLGLFEVMLFGIVMPVPPNVVDHSVIPIIPVFRSPMLFAIGIIPSKIY